MKNFAFLIVTSLMFLGCGDPPATGDDNTTKDAPAGNGTTDAPAGNGTTDAPAGNETGKPEESESTDGAEKAPSDAPDGGN